MNVFSMNILVKMSAVCFTYGQYCKDITCSCTKLWMQFMCFSICLVLCLCIGLVEIFISLLLSHKIIVDESNAKPSSPRIPYNHTHCVATFATPLYLDSAALYSDSVDERDIVCFYLLYQHMVPCESMNR